MHNFFVKNENLFGDSVKIDGADFNQIKNVLRMKQGEQILVSFDGKSSLC